METKHIPVDTWLKIFEEVLAESRRSGEGGRSVTVLLGVCKDWKEAAMPFVFRHVLITSMISLDQLTLLLLNVRPGGSNPGEWTRSLTIRLPVPKSHLANIPTLILSMPNLESYSISGAWVSCAELSLLKHQYLSTLSTFAASVSPDFSADPGTNPVKRVPLYETLVILRDFRNLQHLKLDMFTHHQPMLGIPPDATLLDFPCVEVLEYTAKTRGAISNVGWCRFPALKTFAVQALSGQDANDLSALKSFFLNHSFIPTVKMALPLSWLQTLFLEEAVLAPTIELLDAKGTNIPSASTLPTSLRKLTLHVETNPRQLYVFLKELVDTPSPSLSQLRIVLLKNGTQNRFTWECGTLSDPFATLVGTLVSYAIRLHRHGIDVVDERGEVLRLQ